jgi:hypothetical protein
MIDLERAALLAFARRLNEARLTTAVGSETLREIERAFADVGIAPADRWVWAVTERPESDGMPLRGTLAVPMHIVGRQGIYPFRFSTPYPWDERHSGYRIELFGEQITSEDQARSCSREALWPMTVEEGPSPEGPATLGVAVRRYRVFHRSDRVFGRGDWRPGWPAVEWSYGGVTPGEANSTEAADRGLRILCELPLSGRPAGTLAYESAEKYAELIYREIYDHRDRSRAVDRASPATIAGWLGISEATMDRYRKKFGIGVRDIRRKSVKRPS